MAAGEMNDVVEQAVQWVAPRAPRPAAAAPAWTAEAVLALMGMAIKAAKAKGKYVGICGQGPSDHPDFADWLAQEGIVSISLNPDTVIETWQRVGAVK